MARVEVHAWKLGWNPAKPRPADFAVGPSVALFERPDQAVVCVRSDSGELTELNAEEYGACLGAACEVPGCTAAAAY